MGNLLAPVSVIIPCYRCKNTIEHAVSSVFLQTFRPVELILIDDCSDDGTLPKLYQLQSQYQPNWIKVIRLTQNSGPASARNIGWDNATQPYIAFLDADDSWHANKIEIQYNWMRNHPEVALSGHACVVKDICLHQAIDVEHGVFKRITKWHLLSSNYFSTPSVMLQRHLNFRFMTGKRYSEDYLLWLQINFSGYACYWSNMRLVFLHKHEFGVSGLSSHLWQMQKGEIDNFAQLYQQGLIGFFIFLAVVGWSSLKFLRRVLIVLIRRLTV